MKLFRNILEDITIIAILFISVTDASATSNKEASKDKPKYEIKSDIINFDYSNIGYPINDCKVGFKNISLVNINNTPRVLQRGKPIPTPSKTKIILGGIIYGFIIIFLIIISCVILLIIGFIFEFLMTGAEKILLEKA